MTHGSEKPIASDVRKRKSRRFEKQLEGRPEGGSGLGLVTFPTKPGASSLRARLDVRSQYFAPSGFACEERPRDCG